MRPLTCLVPLIAVLIAAVPPAFAQGMNIAWDDCYLGAAKYSLSNSCTAAGDSIRSLVISVETPNLISDVNGAQGIIDLVFDAPGIPDFWAFQTGGCRQGQLSADAGIGSTSGPYSCAEPWSAVGGVVAAVNFAPRYQTGCNNRARITWIAAIPGLTALDPNVSSEWYIVRLAMAGGGSGCDGCQYSGCLVAYEVRLTRPAQTPGGDVFVNNASTSQHAEWQNPSWTCFAVHQTLPCPTPTIRSTWGQVKGMYR